MQKSSAPSSSPTRTPEQAQARRRRSSLSCGLSRCGTTKAKAELDTVRETLRGYTHRPAGGASGGGVPGEGVHDEAESLDQRWSRRSR